MGCVSSASQPVRAARYVQPVEDFLLTEEEENLEPVEQTLYDIIKIDAMNIMQGLKKLNLSQNMKPTVLTTENAFPLLLADFYFENDISQIIKLPVVAFSRVMDSKIIFIGSIEMLKPDTMSASDSYAFYENLFSWATNFRSAKIRVLLVGETKGADLSGFGVSVTSSDFLPEFSPNTYDIIFSSDDINHDFTKYIENGTSIFIFATYPINNLPLTKNGNNLDNLSKINAKKLTSQIKINQVSAESTPRVEKDQENLNRIDNLDVFLNCGISFATTSLVLYSTRANFVPVDELEKFTFESISKDFLKLFQTDIPKNNENQPTNSNSIENNCNNSSNENNNSDYENLNSEKSDDVKNEEAILLELDSKIVTLRYYIRYIIGYNRRCYEIADKCWKGLQTMNFKTKDGKYFPELKQRLLAMILSELFPKIPPNFITSAPDCNITLPITKSHTFRLPIRINAWNYTGHYLAPGVVATVKSDVDCIIQIGSHFMQLFLKDGPYKRYPVVAHRVNISKDAEVEIASPFGGIVYVLRDSGAAANLTFTNFSMYPFFSYKKIGMYDATKNFKTEWGEISAKGLIFVMPSAKIALIKDKKKFVDMIGKNILAVHEYVGPRIARPQRVIFEPDMPIKQPLFDEVLYMRLKDLDAIIDENQPTYTLYVMLFSILLAEINGLFLNNEVELTIAKVATAATLDKEFPDNDVTANLIIDTHQKGYDTLLKIAKEKGYKPFATGINSLIENINIKTAVEAWTCFTSRFEYSAGVEIGSLEELFWKKTTVESEAPNKLLNYQISGDE
ncbi:hypothetical protein TRFO_06051 [Tritrichomonas foetus]|uniref:Peptidase M60 domain-containing protein n=1 Tax=Tritrichomonas foetus TaxID=1144522 RepID=A0A1J4K6I9_9EUKA|nr:hypothetical protein TRFO_06051 [Tritrichomonas foetus]|eukprot:OHT05061.1 hypothetical protein TRFO_06051 [Tritrichomonas foetus]